VTLEASNTIPLLIAKLEEFLKRLLHISSAHVIDVASTVLPLNDLVQRCSTCLGYVQKY
jgi:hypothetical protein